MMTSSKNSRDLDFYFGIFWKILCSTTLMQSFIAMGAELVQDLWRGSLLPPRLINVKKAQAG